MRRALSAFRTEGTSDVRGLPWLWLACATAADLWDDESWAAWVQAKRDIAAVTLEHGGSISACHGSTREGEVDLVPFELGGGFDVMKKIKRALDPLNVMNPGKYLLDQAYEDGEE